MATANNPVLKAYKLQAKRLVAFLKRSGTTIKHTHALEAVAQMHGHKDFHTLTAEIVTQGGVALGAESATSRFLQEAIDSAIQTADRIALGDEDWEQWHNVKIAHEEGEDDERIVLQNQDAALLAARMACNCFDVEAMASSLPYIDWERRGYAGEREQALRLVGFSELIERKLDACADPDLRGSYREFLDLEGTRYALHGVLAWGFFQDGDYAAAARHARAGCEEFDFDECGMRGAAITLAILAGDLDLAAVLADTDPEFGPILKNLQRIRSDNFFPLSRTARRPLIQLTNLARTSPDLDVAAKIAIASGVSPSGWGPLMDAFECDPWVALGSWLKRSPETLARIEAGLQGEF